MSIAHSWILFILNIVIDSFVPVVSIRLQSSNSLRTTILLLCSIFFLSQIMKRMYLNSIAVETLLEQKRSRDEYLEKYHSLNQLDKEKDTAAEFKRVLDDKLHAIGTKGRWYKHYLL